MSIFVKIFYDPKYSQIFDNLDFNQYFSKTMISLKNNRKILILVKDFETISILVKIFRILDFGRNFWQTPFWSKLSKV